MYINKKLNFFKKLNERYSSNLKSISTEELQVFLSSLFGEYENLASLLDKLPRGFILYKDNKVTYANQYASFFLSSNLQIESILLEEKSNYIINSAEELLFFLSNQNELTFATIFTKNPKNGVFILQKYAQQINNAFMFQLTNSKQMKNKNLYSQSLQSVQALDTLAAGIAHEIKNPLTAIDFYTQSVKKGLAIHQLEKEDLKEYLTAVTEEIQRLKRILDRFLNRMQKKASFYLLIDINELIKELLTISRSILEQEHIKLVLDLGEKLPKTFLDYDAIKQLMINLLKNASQAMKNQKEKVLTIHTSYLPSSEEVVIIVKDTGKGISQSHLNCLFDPYFTTKKDGSGLGLTIVYNIIKNHKGSIEVKSELNKGSSFIIHLPIVKDKYKLLS